MPGPITTGNHPKLMWPGIKALFGVGYGEHPEEFRDLFDISTSSQHYEEDLAVSGFPLVPVKQEGTSTTYASHAQLYVSRYTHVAYSMGWIVTYEELRDNLYPKLAASRSKSLGFSFRQTKENVAANVYNRAFNASYTGGDGQVLVCSTHPSAIGSQSNILSPAADFSEKAIEDMLIQIMGATNWDGLKIGMMAQTLLVPRQIWFEANRVLKSTLRAGTGDNDINVIRMTGEFPGGIKINHYFSDTDAFFMRTNCPDGMKMYQRDSYDLKQDNDFDTDNAKAKSYDRYSVGWSDWRAVYASAGG